MNLIGTLLLYHKFIYWFAGWLKSDRRGKKPKHFRLLFFHVLAFLAHTMHGALVTFSGVFRAAARYAGRDLNRKNVCSLRSLIIPHFHFLYFHWLFIVIIKGSTKTKFNEMTTSNISKFLSTVPHLPSSVFPQLSKIQSGLFKV